MAPIKDDEAVGRTLRLAVRNPIITSAISLLLGGAGGNYYANKETNSKLDRLLAGKNVTVSESERILFLEETSVNLVGRVEKLEADTVRIPYRRRRV